MGAFDDLLGFNPLEAAEEATGYSADDPRTILLAVALNEQNEQIKREELGLRSDTYHHMAFAEALETFQDMGFAVVAVRATGTGEQWKLLWAEDGILLSVESFTPDGLPLLGAAPAFYNLRIRSGLKPAEFLDYVEAGHFCSSDDEVWVGWSDFREGARHKLARLHENGTFMVDWIERPWGAIPPVGSGPARLVQTNQARREDAVRLFMSQLPARLRDMIQDASNVDDPAYHWHEDEEGR